MRMKMLRNNCTILLAALALLLLPWASAGKSQAYFTTYVSAGGGMAVEVKNPETELEEEYEGKKKIRVGNTGEVPCYVRVKAFAGELIKLTYQQGADEGEELAGEWVEGQDGFWYFTGIVGPAERTKLLEISIDAEALKALLQKTEGITGDSLPEGTEAVDARTEELLQSFNVIVIQECTRVRYDDEGKPLPYTECWEDGKQSGGEEA